MKESYLVSIQGTRGYLMHAFKGPSTTSKKAGRNPTPEEDCEDALYRREDRSIYVPSIQIWASMRKAAKNFKLKGRRSFWELVNAGIFVDPDQITMQPQTFKMYSSAVVINRARIMKSRPLFEGWSLGPFSIIATDERLTESSVKDILVEAGQTSGIGDWRPRFGTFTVTSFAKQ